MLTIQACNPSAEPQGGEDLAGPADPVGPPEDMALPQPDLTPGDMATMKPPLGEPIRAPKGEWTWVDFPDSTCNEGTPTGIGVNFTDSRNLLIYLMGGGACWDYLTCFQLGTAVRGPIRKQEFDQALPQLSNGTILDRRIDSPFKDWNLVFVPYCTGDIHGGDNDAMYQGMRWRHKGRANMIAFLRRLAATFPTPDKLVLSGSSAGGYGSSMSYDLVRSYFPGARQAFMINDCGPVLVGDDIPQNLRNAWYASWRLDGAIGGLCPGCKDDLSRIVPILSARYPNDRLSLLAFTQDQTIRNYLGFKPAAQFEVDMLELADKVLDPLPNVRYFYIRSQSHVMLGTPERHTAQGVKLLDWLRQQVGGDPGWKSLRPAP